jgi:hypothetical protein
MEKIRQMPLLRSLSACVLFMFFATVCVALYAQQQQPKPTISADKAKMMGYVEDFFMNNARDITMRKSLEWGDTETDDKGNVSITYKFLALIWDKDRIVLESKFTFDKDGKFVNFEKISAEPVAKEAEFDPKNVTQQVMQGLVEKFFSQNFRDITARKTLKWGEMKTNDDGTFLIDYQCEATIWDKDRMVIEYRFTFDQTGQYVKHETLERKPLPVE